MNRSRHSLPIGHALLATTTVFVSTLYPLESARGQPTQDAAGATTVSSKQKVNVIIDRERAPDRTWLLLKILVPQDAKVESFALENPARIVVDFIGVSIKTSENLVPPKNDVVKMIRLGAHAEKLRIVMDLSTPTTPQYEWRGGARQATLRILESVNAVEPTKAPQAAPPTATPLPPAPPTTAPTSAPTTAPTVQSTATPASTPTNSPTNTTTVTPTVTPTTTPTLVPTKVATVAPTMTHTAVPTAPPTVAPTVEQRAAKTEPKLPEMTEQELEEALDKEVARASQALERGEELPDPVEAEGEDLVEVPVEDLDDVDLSEEKDSGAGANQPTSKNAALVTKDLPTGVTNEKAPAPSDSVGGLRSNAIPAAPVTEFTVQRAEFSFLEPEHKEAFRISLSKTGAQAQMSKVDPTTYKIAIPRCGLANLGLALPQYPPADYKGILAVSPKVEGDTVEITVQVEEGVSLSTLMRDKELWIKRQ
jgi:hypothetical protein